MTNPNREQILNLYSRGKTAREIAAVTGNTYHSVRGVIRWALDQEQIDQVAPRYNHSAKHLAFKIRLKKGAIGDVVRNDNDLYMALLEAHIANKDRSLADTIRRALKNVLDFHGNFGIIESEEREKGTTR